MDNPPSVPEDADNPIDRDDPHATRKRLSLNLKMTHYRELQELTRWLRAPTVVAAILKTMELTRKMYLAEHPEAKPDERWRDMPPSSRELPAYWAVHTPRPDGTEDVRRLWIL